MVPCIDRITAEDKIAFCICLYLPSPLLSSLGVEGQVHNSGCESGKGSELGSRVRNLDREQGRTEEQGTLCSWDCIGIATILSHR